MRHTVTAKHKIAKYAVTDHPIKTGEDGNLFFADAAIFGCSKSYRTRHDAIFAMLQDHGCFAIKVTDLNEPND